MDNWRISKGSSNESIISGVNLLMLTYPLNGLLMIALPLVLAVYLTRKFHLSWGLWGIGGVTFIVSQVAHIPFNLLWLNPRLAQLSGSSLPEPLPWLLIALALGLSAGLFEETARYAMYRWWAKEARSWAKGLLAGAGHGGFEAVILGALVLLAFLQLLAIRNTDLAEIVPPEQLELAQAQVSAYWTAEWSETLLGALERAFSLAFHLSASVLVLQAFTRKQIGWLGLAIAWHALLDASAVIASRYLNSYLTEALIGIFALLSLGIIFRLRQPEPLELTEQEYAPLPSPLSAISLHPVEENEVNLEKSRYDPN